MPTRITKTQRWLDLLALLLGRKLPLSVEEIMERVPAYATGWSTGEEKAQASARRMFERDKDELREMGIPLETVRYGINYGAEELEGYRITRSDFYLPYLRILSAPDEGDPRPAPRPAPGVERLDLAPAEAELALDALRRVEGIPAFPFAEEARSALRKLTFDVDMERFPGEPVHWVEQPGAEEVLARLRVLSDALLARKRVRFRYHGIHRGEPTEREVAPYGLFFQRDWYLVGHAAVRDAVRVFRVARMEVPEPNTRAPKQPDYDIPPDFQLSDHLDRSAWELGEEDDAATAELRFRFPLSAWAARNEVGELVREEEDGGAVCRFRVSQPNPFLRWVLSQGGEAEILSPPDLRSELEAMAREVMALYGEPAEEAGTHG
ncbi:MAG TPA: WYL domain-containing protein [Longimicrobiaceae bacterium]|nr:WYL domain-containing protein [Longimicrobiaceae bacterium]